MFKKIAQHSTLYTVANHAPLFANLFLLPVISPFLTTNDYGIYGLIYAYKGALDAFGMLGLVVLIQNAYFKDKLNYKQLWSKYFGFLMVWRLLYTLLVGVVFYFVFRSLVGSQIIEFLSLILIPILLFEVTRTFATRFCQYEGKHHYIYLTSLITSVVSIITSFTCIYYYKMGYMGWLVAACFSKLVEFLIYFWIIHFKQKLVPTFRLSTSFLKKSLKIAIPTIPHRYSNFLLETSDRIVLERMKVPIQQIGEYNIAYSFSNYFASFNNSLNTILTPVYFRCFAMEDRKESKNLISSITLVWFLFIAIVCYMLCLWGREVFEFLYRNPDLNQSYRYLPFIMVGMLYRPLYVAVVDRAIFEEKTREILKISVIAGCVNVILNIVFIPYFGINAALASTFLSYIYMGFSGYYIKGIRSYATLNYSPIYFLGMIGVVLAGAYFSMYLEVFYKLLISLILIVVTLIFYLKKGKFIIQKINDSQISI